jgi:DNA mismatch endonuclease, patch repair protein
MSDIFSKELRSYIMSKIRSQNTKPELLVRKFLYSKGFRYRINVKYLPGKPDIVLKKYNTAIFVNGCFWHGHPPCFVLPRTRIEYWSDKINHNRVKDKKNKQELIKMGWEVIYIWECQLNRKKVKKTLDNLLLQLSLCQGFQI